MRTARFVHAWSAIVLASGASVGCAAATSSAPEGLRSDAGIAEWTPAERRQMRDSANAQAVADEVGPRVTVMADFDYAGGSRRVEASFHMYDDAYAIVGQLDAAGRLSVVFPSAPGDDGFVRGDKIYHVPSFFAGFSDEYAWRYSDYRHSSHSVASRRDSYDAGLGYVFVIASWRPMRLDRITDGNRWQTYEVSDVNYMHDPREAIEELGALIAGDNREAYTIEYAHYSTTNYGTYALSDFDAVNSGCYGYREFGFSRPSLFFSPFGFLPSRGFGFGSASCNAGFNGGFGYGYSYGYPVGYTPITSWPVVPRGPAAPIGAPIFHLPRSSGTQGVALHRPRPEAVPSTPVSGTAAMANEGQYRRPGLITEDAARPRGQGQGRGAGADNGFAQRPTIQQMIGNRRIDEGSRAATRDAGIRDNSSWSTNRGGTSTRESGRTYGGAPARESGRTSGGESARTAPRGESRGESTRMTPSHSEPRSESPRAAPAHSEPSARSTPAASTSSGSSSGSRKPK